MKDERALARSAFFWISLVASLIGLLGIVVFKEGFAFDASLMGVGLGLGCSLARAVYTILARVCFQQTDARINFSVITIYTVVALTVPAFLFGKPQQLFEMDITGWVYVVVSGITSIALAHVFFYVAIKRIGATIPSMVLLAAPLTTILASRILFNETLRPLQWLFGAILIAGAAAAILAQRDLHKNRQ